MNSKGDLIHCVFQMLLLQEIEENLLVNPGVLELQLYWSQKSHTCQQASKCPTMTIKTVTRVAAVGVHPGLCNWLFFEEVPGAGHDLRQPSLLLGSCA